MKLSYNRASSVARIAQSAGARIADVRGYGEVCLLLQIKQRTACKITARLKLSAFVKGTKMTFVKIIMACSLVASLGACEVAGSGNKSDKTIDRGFDKKHLSQLVAGVWVDPNGCDHWIIDDSVKGYLSQRLDKYGKPVCSGIAEPNTATGLFKSGSTFGDPI